MIAVIFPRNRIKKGYNDISEQKELGQKSMS